MAEPTFQRVEDLFHRAADLTPADQTALLDTECAGDPGLRAAVEELLRQDVGDRKTEPWLTSPVERAAEDLAVTKVGPAQPAAARLRPRAIAGYEILEEIGSGGMGVVFKARQTALQRVVALKMLLPASGVAAEHVARFRTEAEALARLQHPNIVQIFEVGEYEGRPYLAMEYVDGPDLARRLDGKPQPPREAARLVEVLARAVQAVHDCGIIHRDLKPANVLLVSGGVVSGESSEDTTHHSPLTTHHLKITDFGLAVDPATSRRLTEPGLAVGTPCYMAPEQARGRTGRIGPAVDVYAMGVILYEALTGRPPFAGATPETTVAQLLMEEPVSPARLRPGLPRDLVTICLKCLEKDPRRRYARAADLADDLRRFLDNRPILARPVGPVGRTWRWCRRRPLVATLTALLILLTVGLAATVVVYEDRLRAALATRLEDTQERLSTSEHEAQEEQHELAELHGALGLRLMAEGDTFTALLWFTEALDLDGGRPDSKYRLWIGAVLQHCPRLERLRTCDQPVRSAALGGTGCWAVTVDEAGVVRVLDLLTGKTVGRGFVPERRSRPVGVSPDGRLIATAAADGMIQVWRRDNGKPEGPPIRHIGQVEQASFSGDDRILLVRDQRSRMEAWDLARRGRAAEGELIHAACNEGSHWLWTVHAGNRGRLWDTTTGKAASPFHELGRPVRLAAPSADGRRVVLVDDENSLWVLDTRAGRTRLLARLPRTEGVVEQVRWSRDGSWVLTVARDHVRVWNAASGLAVTPPLRQTGPLLAAAFGGEHRLRILDADGLLEVWELPDPAAVTVQASEAAGAVRRPAGARAPSEVALADGRIIRVNQPTTAAVLSSWNPARVIEQAVFSADGSRAAIATADHAVQVWDTRTRQPLTPPLAHAERLAAVAFLAGGRDIVVVGTAGHVRRWTLTPDERPVDQLQTLARALAGHRLEHPGRLVHLHRAERRSAWEATRPGV
jgi:serine/threonine protein kinase/WD40 repeat protein